MELKVTKVASIKSCSFYACAMGTPSCCRTVLFKNSRWEVAPVQVLLRRLFTTSAKSCQAYNASAEPSKSHAQRKNGRVTSRPRSTSSRRGPLLRGDAALLECSEAAREDCNRDVVVVPEFVSAEEEASLLQEIGRTLRGKRYLYNHWDGAIEGYRETEKVLWGEANSTVIQRLKDVVETVMEGQVLRALDEIHVLDLAEDGFIKPHIDSVKFCGEVIAGLTLLSPCVMVFEHEGDPDRWIHALLPPLSLYIMRGPVRFSYTHAIPTVGEQSRFRGEVVVRDRRVSVISRTHPSENTPSV